MSAISTWDQWLRDCTNCAGGCTDSEACDHDECGGCACAGDDDEGDESPADKPTEYGGKCRHCGCYDKYPERGADGMVCCYACADKERR